MVICFFLIACLASTIGAISGIGGGVIIKPIMELFGFFDSHTINFLSGCTVLSMSVTVYLRNLNAPIKLDYHLSIPLSVAAILGGIIGNIFLSTLEGNISFIQSFCMLVINIAVLIYTILKPRIHTKELQNVYICLLVGLFLGFTSAFLGIGGGPLNLVVISYCFSMPSKIAARNSLFIILCAQSASLFTTIWTDTIPIFDWSVLVLMCLGAISGAFIGQKLSHDVSNQMVEKLFQYTTLGLIFLNLYNLGMILLGS